MNRLSVCEKSWGQGDRAITCKQSFETAILPTFLVIADQLINVTKVHLTMMYSLGKLNNEKVITTACNFWRQIACSLQVYGGTNHHNFCAKLTWKTLYWISHFFFTWPTLKSQAVFADNFYTCSKIGAKKIEIFNCEYLGDAWFKNWGETS